MAEEKESALAQLKKLQELFKAYVADKTVLIVDTSHPARASLAKILGDLGANRQKIHLASTYEIAEQEINQKLPEIVLTDYNLGKKCGLDLLQKQREKIPDARKSLFILVTGNTSQSTVAQAAEEDVDTFILKPYTAEVLRQSIIRAATAKIYPSDYAKLIEQGKEKMESGALDEAMKLFDDASKMDSKPSLAHFYIGQVHLLKKAMEPAEGSYSKGLEYNKIHYKCLVGLFETLLSQKREQEAYEVVKKIARYFPANPNRMAQVLRLAVVTKSYDDIERYYQMFLNIEQRNEELIRYVCAALVVCGKHYLAKKLFSRAIPIFQKAAATGYGQTKILREIITSLIATDRINDAKTFLAKFQPTEKKKEDFLTSELIVNDRVLAPSLVIDTARKLINSGIANPEIYRILIRRSVEAEMKGAAETLVDEAVSKWPGVKEEFQGLLKGKPAPA